MKALIIVDAQLDFFQGGALAVPHSNEVLPALNKYILIFEIRGQSTFFTRDWHPPDHISFRTQGGPWPPHGVRHTEGARFHPKLTIPKEAVIISKAEKPAKDAYSGFEDTDLHTQLTQRSIKSIYIGGLATDYCVKHTVLDGLKLGYEVFLLTDAIKGVNMRPSDSQDAIQEMIRSGAITTTFDEL